MGKTALPPARVQKIMVQTAKEPRPDLGRIPQLASFRSPRVKGLLGQIFGVGFRPRQAERELVERPVIPLYQFIKLRVGRHTFELLG
jgi:hypothetical protein